MPVLRAALGLCALMTIAWLLSTDRRRPPWRVIAGGLLLQVVFAWAILLTGPGRMALAALSEGVTRFLAHGHKGAEFVFGPLTQFQAPPPPADPRAVGDPVRFVAPWMVPESASASWPIVLAFRALPIIIFFSAVMGILYHFGIIQFLVALIARVLTGVLRISGAEALAMAANIFCGQTEAPLVVKPYIARMTSSELMALMTGGFATIAGSVLAAYVGLLGPEYAGHLLAASVMSAPAAFVMAKILLPERERPETAGRVQPGLGRTTRNVLDAAATGTADGLRLYMNVLAMLIAFVSLVAVLDWPLSALEVDGAPLSLRRIFGWAFAPLAWLMGVAWTDCASVGSLLGTKIAVNEFMAYADLAAVKAQGLAPRSSVIAAYALCGFANFASIGIQIGGIGALVPERREDLVRLGLRAMIGGALASWMTATIAGAFLHA
jgi:CNT family concentrative nucleoside transporter